MTHWSEHSTHKRGLTPVNTPSTSMGLLQWTIQGYLLGAELFERHGGVGHVGDRLDGDDHGVQFSFLLLRQQGLVQGHRDEQVLHTRHCVLQAPCDTLHAWYRTQTTWNQHCKVHIGLAHKQHGISITGYTFVSHTDNMESALQVTHWYRTHTTWKQHCKLHIRITHRTWNQHHKVQYGTTHREHEMNIMKMPCTESRGSGSQCTCSNYTWNEVSGITR